ncbi:MAG: 4-hydroxy-tetrahydrodipicolinate reductase [bacterium]|nr:4-hydroxy-tetrahydrodipicolinate reductase [bacterium]
MSAGTSSKAISILVHGAGRMGSSVMSVAGDAADVTIRGTVDLRPRAAGGADNVAYFDHIPAADDAVEVVIDFSNAGSMALLIQALAGTGVKLVSGTTGLRREDRDALSVYAEVAAVFYDENMSYGISLLKHLLREIGSRRNRFEDVEIVEIHHRGKRDYPSGTALALSRVLSPELPAISGRSSNGPGVHVHSVRLGSVPGEHHVHFSSDDEMLTLSHRALTRDVFARGAIDAARFLSTKTRGLYSMDDLVTENRD